MDVREKLVELLSQYFDIGDSYCYNLTRTKNAFACGTMGFDDFKEFDDETISDIADYLIDYGVTVQEWISVDDRLPDWRDGKVLVFTKYGFSICERTVNNRWQGQHANWITHWCRLPKPPKGE